MYISKIQSIQSSCTPVIITLPECPLNTDTSTPINIKAPIAGGTPPYTIYVYWDNILKKTISGVTCTDNCGLNGFVAYESGTHTLRLDVQDSCSPPQIAHSNDCTVNVTLSPLKVEFFNRKPTSSGGCPLCIGIGGSCPQYQCATSFNPYIEGKGWICFNYHVTGGTKPYTSGIYVDDKYFYKGPSDSSLGLISWQVFYLIGATHKFELRTTDSSSPPQIQSSSCNIYISSCTLPVNTLTIN